MSRSGVSRRDLVRLGLVAGILPLGSWAGATTLPLMQPRQERARLHKLVIDRGIPESARLGALAGSIADEVFLFDGDLTRLWHDELRLQWPKGPRPIAGLTAPGVRLVLEQFGRDHNARIVFSAEHREIGGRVRHSLSGCDALLRSAQFDEGADWVAEMAKLLAACPCEPPARLTSIQFTSGPGARALSGQYPLVTWLLAPTSPPGRRYNPTMVS